MKKSYWFILEVETGLIDGWYIGNNIDSRIILQHWNEERPGYRHIVCHTNDQPGYLIDDLCLNRNLSGPPKRCDKTIDMFEGGRQ